jgi:transcriptional regulator with XRE-family HTH domain
VVRVEVKAELLRWARDRASLTVDALLSKFPKLEQWESGELQPTLRQIESYARVTYAPVGYFFLSAPPEEPLPVPDFRAMVGREMRPASPNLRDMIYACQERQDWYRDNARMAGNDCFAFVGSVNLVSPIVETAAAMRRAMSFDLERLRTCSTWAGVLRLLIDEADRLGILVMCSGIVMNNTHRGLDAEEFRGFALSDDLAPLVFVNGADAKSAQVFTLAHELAHIWCKHASNIDQLFGEHATINQMVATPIGVQSGRRFIVEAFTIVMAQGIEERDQGVIGALTEPYVAALLRNA